jgi:hypothetical protein
MIAQRFYHWYWMGWYERRPWPHWARLIVGWIEERFTKGEALGNVVAARWICPRVGSDIQLDQCGRPEHAYCIRCNGLCH